MNATAHTPLCSAILEAVAASDNPTAAHTDPCPCHSLATATTMDEVRSVFPARGMTPPRRATDLDSGKKAVIEVSLLGLSHILNSLRLSMRPDADAAALLQMDKDIERCGMALKFVQEA